MIQRTHPSRECRLHPRVRVTHLDVLYRPGGFLHALFSPARKGSAHDLSEGGMRLIAPSPAAPGTWLAFQPQAAFIHEAIPLRGRVLRCQEYWGEAKGSSGHLYAWGIALTHPGEGYLSLLQRLRCDPMLIKGM